MRSNLYHSLRYIFIKGLNTRRLINIKILKSLTAILITLSVLICITVSASAQFYYDSNADITLLLTYSSNEATCYAKIDGGKGTKSISNGKMVLTDSSGGMVQSWSNLSSTGAILTVSKTAKDVTKGETYTLTITATVNGSTSSEEVSDSVTVKY